MNDQKSKSDTLRTKAESLLAKTPDREFAATRGDMLDILHELHVHQIELEIQNEALQGANKAVEKSQAEYMRLYHDAPIGYVVLDQAGIVRKVNKSFGAMLDNNPERVNGIPFAEFLVEEDQPIFRARLKAFYKNPVEKQIDLRLQRSDKPMHISIQAMVNEDEVLASVNGLNELLVTVTDISARKEMEEDLRSSQRELSLYNDIATIFLTSEPESIFHDVLDLLLETFESSLGFVGYINNEGDLICPTMTRHIWDECQVPDKDIVFPKEKWGGIWGQSLLEKRSILANEKLLAPIGHVTLENAMAVPIHNQGKLIGQFVLANKNSGYDDRDLNLLENAAKQTAPIMQSLLDRIEQQKLEKRLEKVNRELHKVEGLNRMAGAIAHSYNNLLTIVLGNLEIAVDNVPKQQEYLRNCLESAMEAARQGGNIGGMLLMYLGQGYKNVATINLSRQVKNFLARFSKEKKIRFTATLDLVDQPPAISVDPEHIDKILENLINNGIEAQSNNPAAVAITLNVVKAAQISANNRFPMGWQPFEEEYLCMAVDDSGSGIHPHNIEKLFDPFYSEKFTGRGMGLAVVQGIVQLYNGAITVESLIGKGSTFRIYLPVVKDNTSVVG